MATTSQGTDVCGSAVFQLAANCRGSCLRNKRGVENGLSKHKDEAKQGTQGIALCLEKEKRKETKEDLERKSKKNIGYEYVKGAASGGLVDSWAPKRAGGPSNDGSSRRLVRSVRRAEARSTDSQLHSCYLSLEPNRGDDETRKPFQLGRSGSSVSLPSAL